MSGTLLGLMTGILSVAPLVRDALQAGIETMAEYKSRVKDPETGLWLKQESSKDDAVLVVQVRYQIPKEERDNYQFPNFVAADCLRQEIARWEAEKIALADLIWNPYVQSRTVQVTR